MAVILGAGLAITSLLLVLSVYPGFVSEVSFFAAITSPFWVPTALLSFWAFADVERETAGLFEPPPRWRKRRFIAALIIVLNCVLTWCGVPCRLAFLYSRPAFEPLIAAAPPPYSGGAMIERQIGFYHVDRVTADPRGGIYFRTRSGRDGFHSSATSYGFAYQPNEAGSPFGDEKYALLRLSGEWYLFQARER
jgi:hypothetical protein